MDADGRIEYVPMIRDMKSGERPRERLKQLGPQALSTAELLAIILRVGVKGINVLHMAELMLVKFDGLSGLARSSVGELSSVHGVSDAKAVQVLAALELGRRRMAATPDERPRITQPQDAANLLMSEMMFLEQEHLRTILLNTRSEVLASPTIYKGSLNTSVVRIGEVFREAVRSNAAALIVAHNHPSGDPSPSPEDIHVTRELVRAGKLLSIEVLDHVVIGRHRFVSLKERGLGFEN